MDKKVNPDDIWKEVSNICIKSAQKVIGNTTTRTEKHKDEPLKKLSNHLQKDLRSRIESSTKKERRIELKKERNKTINKVKARIRIIEEANLNKEIEELEMYKEDTIKYYQVMRSLITKSPKKHLKPKMVTANWLDLN